MNILPKAYYVSMVFWKIIEAQEVGHDLTSLVRDVQQFYLSPSIFIVYEKLQYDFSKEERLLSTIKSHSRQYSMSQAITYDQLNRISLRRDNILHTLIIHNSRNLQRAIDATKNIKMSLHPWLLLFFKKSRFDCNEPGTTFFRLRMDTKMMVKCEGNNILKRYYGIIDNQTEVDDLAEWSPGKKLRFKNEMKSLSEYETNMKGITLKLAKRDEKIEEASENLAQFLSHLMTELESLGNFKTKVTIREASAGKYDKKSQNWTGLINVLYNKKVDIGMFLFSMSTARLTAVDFAAPLAKARFYLFAKLPEAKKVLWGAYFQAFDLLTWIVMGLSILITAFLLSLVKNDRQGYFVHNFFGNFISEWGIYCQQGLADPPSNTPTQIVYFSILITSLVLNTIYSATITSYIAVLSPKLPFDTYEQFKLDTKYEVTVVQNNQDEDLILDNDSYLAPLMPRLKVSCERPFNPYEAYQQACEPNTAFYSDEVTFDGLKYNPPCQLGRLDMKRFEYESIILIKNSPYTRTINYFIGRLRDHGILKRLKNRYFYKYTEYPDNQPNVISVEEVLPILAVWCTGVVVTLIVWFFEVITFCTISFFRSMNT